ncbi:hypothetical protein EYF80_011428 [Liparis tanakae]|uniref:Uncharacterized protein n=1 Tax=Liparis tanakae TaxID=230148 RepID=A0A4Z2ILV4_9TELE|nr:hypothetical protein EYF80_011428 [Liparis tanakae]
MRMWLLLNLMILGPQRLSAAPHCPPCCTSSMTEQGCVDQPVGHIQDPDVLNSQPTGEYFQDEMELQFTGLEQLKAPVDCLTPHLPTFCCSSYKTALSSSSLYSSSSHSLCRVLSGSLSCTGIATLDRSLPMLFLRMFHRLMVLLLGLVGGNAAEVLLQLGHVKGEVQGFGVGLVVAECSGGEVGHEALLFLGLQDIAEAAPQALHDFPTVLLDEVLLLLRDTEDIFCDMAGLRSSEPISADWPRDVQTHARSSPALRSTNASTAVWRQAPPCMTE